MSAPQGYDIRRPTNPEANQYIGGKIYEFNLLEPQGRQGPFKLPGDELPNAQDFPEWVEYYVEAVGAYIELLNAIQSKLGDDPETRQREFSDRLAELAGLLNVGPGTDTQVLVWPFATEQKCSPKAPREYGGFQGFTVTLDGKDSCNKYAVANCKVLVHATWEIAPASDSSSYLATGSSSG